VPVFLLLIVGACETVQQAQITEFKRSGELRILLMPPDVELATLTAGGVLEPNAEWTKAALGYITPSIREEMRSANIKIVEFSPPAERGPISEDELQIVKVHGVVGQSILVHQFAQNLSLPSKKGTFDWSLGPKVRMLRNRLNADYALFVFMRDSYATAGRAALIFFGAMFGVGIPGGAQIGFTSLVDLRTGNIVWFNRLARAAGDLRTAEPARETVKALLTNFPK